jgi:hypothetical protein
VGVQSPLPVAAMEMKRTEIPQNLFPVEVAEAVEQKPVPGAPKHPKSSKTVSLRNKGGVTWLPLCHLLM